MLTVLAVIVLVLNVVGTIGAPFLVGEPRDPLTPGGALATMIFGAAGAIVAAAVLF